jgi:hypothetical protein
MKFCLLCIGLLTAGASPASFAAPTTFVKQAVWYVEGSLEYSCDSNFGEGEREARRVAENSAYGACLEAGKRNCGVTGSYITKSGQLNCEDVRSKHECAISPVITFYSGCVARAIARGH